MTEQDIRNRIADCAVEYLGCNEADGSHREIIDLYNSIKPLPRGYKMTYRDPWCAAFVSAVGQELGIPHILLPECGCDAMIDLYKKKGQWREADDYIAKVADVVMYDWQDGSDYSGNNSGSADHTGIIYATDGKKMTVIEGNISDSVNFRTLSVNGRYIRGYCCPDYASLISPSDESGNAPNAEPAEVSKTPQTAYISVKLPVLRNGNTGITVGAMQALVMYYGYSVGVDGADGDFGANTQRGVTQFQRDRKLPADGICGEETWKKLLNVQEEKDSD
jgi:hypothetical protein